MGDIDQPQFVQKYQEQLTGPFLEVGSRNYGNTQDLRSMFPGETYIGVGPSEGGGVDAVMDLPRPFDVIDGTPSF